MLVQGCGSPGVRRPLPGPLVVNRIHFCASLGLRPVSLPASTVACSAPRPPIVHPRDAGFLPGLRTCLIVTISK